MGKRKRKPKLSPEEIMARIINTEQLKERKEVSKQNIKENNKEKEIKVEEIKELKWFEKPMVKDKFIIKEIDNKFYAQYEGWKPNIWIGAYNSEQELLDVIKMYIKETKKKPIDRNMRNIHSIIIDI